jgi:isopentenyl-diphosphate delta-isomerase
MSDVTEKPLHFEKRKQDHIRLSLDDSSQSPHRQDWERYQLKHNAFPEINLKEVDISTSFFSHKLSAPFFISSMTAGHAEGVEINMRLARISHEKQILMGLGSQRRELNDLSVQNEWKEIRKNYPRALWLSNIGLSQVITHSTEAVLRLLDSTQSLGLIVHTNPLQEALQTEGTTQFKGGLLALEKLVKASDRPIIVKEVGSGFSLDNLKRLESLGVSAVDLSGRSGTHWGRIEGLRAKDPVVERASKSFLNWGSFALDSLLEAQHKGIKIPLWVSGGVRSGVDVAKSLALGAELVGLAQPWLKAATISNQELECVYRQLELELKTSLFCTGSKNIKEIQNKAQY